MPKMVITPEDIADASSKVTNAMNTQQEIINKIETLVYEMFAEWEGQAKKNFQTKFEAAEPDYKKFQPDLSKFADFLRVYANTMEQLDAGGGRTGA